MKTPTSFPEMIRRGGVYYNVGGSTPSDVLSQAVSSIELPADLDRRRLLEAILQRESLMPTALGNGIAIPHPRSPMIFDPAAQSVCVLFLKSPVQWAALDRLPVSVLFLILSADARSHLALLAELTHLSRTQEFRQHLAQRPSTEELIGYIKKAEELWSRA